jgi:peptide/nickel transport system substrate-binding protein
MHNLFSQRRLTGFVVLTFTLVVLLTSGVNSAQGDRVLVIGHAEFTDSLDPARAFSTTGFIVHKAVYETLVTFPPATTETIAPLLAESWDVADDGTVYTFTLREDAVFANGDPVTASDVVFSFNRLQNIQGNAAFLANTIASVEAPDNRTVIVNLTQPDPTILARLVNTAFAVTNAAQIIEQGGTDAEDATDTDSAEEWLNNNSAGSGPYVLISWEAQNETVLVRNENYWGEPAYFDRVIIANIPEAATQKTAIQGGDVDIVTDLTPDQIPDLIDREGVEVFQGPTSNLHFLTMNTDPEVGGPLANPLVQRAVRYALDYDAYTQIWGGVNSPSIIPVGFLGVLGPEHAFSRDLDRARELLAEAGYPDGFETTLSYPSWTFAGVQWDTNAQKIQADLAEIGIIVNLNPGDVGVQFEAYRNGTQAFGYWFWHPDYIDPGNHLVFLPSRTLGLRMNWTDENADQEILDLRDRAEVELDPEARVEIFQAIQIYMQESGPWAPFLQNGVQVAYRTGIQGEVYHPQWIIDITQISREE